MMLPQVPLVLDDLATQLALDALADRVHVNDVLLQVKRVAERFPAKGAETWLHAAPSLASGGICNRAKEGN